MIECEMYFKEVCSWVEDMCVNVLCFKQIVWIIVGIVVGVVVFEVVVLVMLILLKMVQLIIFFVDWQIGFVQVFDFNMLQCVFVDVVLIDVYLV